MAPLDPSTPRESGSSTAGHAAGGCACQTVAISYAQLGLSVIPIRGDGSKMPLVAWKPFQDEPATLEQVSHWFDGDVHGMAVVAGQVSGGIELLEFEGRALQDDLHHQFRDLCEAAGLGELLTRVLEGCVHRSPGDGLHLVLRTEAPVPNQKLARRPSTAEELAAAPGEPVKVLIETRGEGGYFIVPPSHGTVHTSGRPWTVACGDLSSVATISVEERDALYEVARALDAMPATDHKTERSGPDERPGDRYDAAPDAEVRMEELLVTHGWSVVHRRAGITYLRRPGKDHGVSATIGRHPGLFYVFSTSTLFEAPRGYSPFSVYAILEHGGDFGAAARALANEERGRMGGEPGGSGRSVPPDEDAPWPDIEPLLPDAPLSPFPTELLPEWMAAMVAAVAANTETDPAMAAVTALGLASVPLSNRYAVQTRVWTEHGINLFTAAIADSGELKSAVFTALDEPLRCHEHERQDDELPGRRDQQQRRKDIEARVSIARDELKKAMKAEVAARTKAGQAPETEGDEGAPDETVAEAERRVATARDHLRRLEAESDADADEEVAPYVLLADDATQEALQRQMAQQDGRVGIVSAESELFLMAAGRYSDKAPSLQVYLAGFSGDPLRPERITREAPPVAHPGLAIVISTQPVVVEEARRNAHFQRRGLLARFLYAVPASRAGSRHLADRPAVPVAVAREYTEALMRLCRLGDEQRSIAPLALRLVGEAGRDLERWHDDSLEPRRHRETGDLGASEAMAPWAGRLHGLVARVAGILHVCRHLDRAADISIEPETVAAAIRMGEWAIEHAYAAFGIERLDRVGHDAMRVRRWYRSRSDATFKARDASRGIRALDAERIHAAVLRLEDHGYVRLARTKSGSAGGRPSEIVTINPADLVDG